MPLVSSYLSLSCKHRPPLASWMEDSETMHDSAPHQAPLEADQRFKPNRNTTNTTTNKKRSTARNCSKLDCPNTVLLSHKGSKHCEKSHDVTVSVYDTLQKMHIGRIGSAQRSPEKCQDEGPTLSSKEISDIDVKPWRDWSCWMSDSGSPSMGLIALVRMMRPQIQDLSHVMRYPNLSCFLDLKCDETNERNNGMLQTFRLSRG